MSLLRFDRFGPDGDLFRRHRAEGHAHNGAMEGRTSTGVPVYNVALPLRRRLTPAMPFLILEV